MTLVRIIDLWNVTFPLRQTPGQRGIWDGITYTMDDISECDYVIVLNSTKKKTEVLCPPENVWYVMQEPPNTHYLHWHRNPPYASRTYTNDSTQTGPCYVQNQPLIPWQIDKDYDFLSTCPVPEKTRDLSWIVSTRTYFEGQLKRLYFLESIREQLEFDLWGRGFDFIEDKWDGLAPYRYSLAVENHSNSHYWTEKLTDCFLAWSMPIYYGCTQITDYFPEESLVQIDINDPDEAVLIIKDAIKSKKWERNLDAIAHARDLILNRYQLFPYMTNQIHAFEQNDSRSKEKQRVVIKPRTLDTIKTMSISALGIIKGAAPGSKTPFRYQINHLFQDFLEQVPRI